MTRAALLAYIDNNVYPNANNEITALMVRDVLHRMVDFLGDAATYGVGDVALNNGGLVTGGAVQSAINTTLSSAIMFQGVTTTPLTDGSTNPNITIDGESYTAHRGDEVIYGGKEFLWTGTKWQQLGDEESWAAKTITISAGAGLTGGGNLTQNRTILLSQDSLEKLALAASAYQLPTGGIPLADLAAGVQSSLGKADSAYQLPQGGIPKTDLASAVQNSLGKADTVAGYFSNDKLKLQNLPDLYVARTQVSGTAANKTLYGVDGISAAAAADANDKSLIEWDAEHKAWHLIGNFYADGFVTAGGYSSGGGGGGGASLAAMWETLTNTSSDHTYDSTKIHTAHIPDMASAYGYVKTADISDMATKAWVTAQGYITDSAFDNDFATISAALQSLQSQVDSVAARDSFDELTATAAFVDMLAAGSIIADDAEIGGYSLKAIPNAYLANSAITINGTATALGSSFNTANITAGTAGTSSATTGASFAIPYVTVNAYGIVTGYGTHTHSVSLANLVGSSTIGSASIPVYYNGSALAACTASSLFSALSSSAATNLSVTVAGQTRTATLYATYDSASENISDKFGIVGSALQSLQGQIDAVASRVDLSDYEATTEAKMDYICDLMRSLQSQIDSVASRFNSDEIVASFVAADSVSVTGNLVALGYITSGNASDARLKKDVKTMTDNEALRLVMALRPVTFRWNEKATELYSGYAGDDLGFIAQEVEPLVPSAIGSIFGEYKRLEATKLIAPLVGVAQDHERRIADLERVNKVLKRRLNIN